ncbi:CDAN1-interacting nuclease 1 [Drosophila tropicalis]|uniref:CDAN1-interacting nuclease 1 n=1 Tax=Drosophila tropicalis TaxID=46794 RepID=UPI0035ABFAFB
MAVALPNKKKKILTADEYTKICSFINNYRGLAIDCEMEMKNRHFLDIEPLALTCIAQTEHFNRAKRQHWKHEQRSKKLLKTFEELCLPNKDNDVIIRMAFVENMNPIALCRIILQEKYDIKQKQQISRYLKFPHLIDDPRLAVNVQQCVYSDNQDGPLTDLRRRIIGEEYELKLKSLANQSGIHFYDEQDLRRMGFDKTPDIKIILPFLYNNSVVNWIESKANFGDPKTHKWNIQQQLQSYCNRFGPGIVIYWFGYHVETPNLPDNDIGITVLADFPDNEDLVFMKLITTTDVTETKPNSDAETKM